MTEKVYLVRYLKDFLRWRWMVQVRPNNAHHKCSLFFIITGSSSFDPEIVPVSEATPEGPEQTILKKT